MLPDRHRPGAGAGRGAWHIRMKIRGLGAGKFDAGSPWAPAAARGCTGAGYGLTHTPQNACNNSKAAEYRTMRHGRLVMAGLLGAMVLAAAGCSGGGDAYALRGTPTPRSGTDTGNFLISGKTCKYVTMVGFYSDAQVLTYPCKV